MRARIGRDHQRVGVVRQEQRAPRVLVLDVEAVEQPDRLRAIGERLAHQRRALAQLERDRHPGLVFLRELVAKRRELVAPRHGAPDMQAHRRKRHAAAPQIVAGGNQAALLPGRGAGGPPLHGGGDLVVAVGDDVDRDGHDLAGDALDRKLAAIDRGARVLERDARAFGGCARRALRVERRVRLRGQPLGGEHRELAGGEHDRTAGAERGRGVGDVAEGREHVLGGRQHGRRIEPRLARGVGVEQGEHGLGRLADVGIPAAQRRQNRGARRAERHHAAAGREQRRGLTGRHLFVQPAQRGGLGRRDRGRSHDPAGAQRRREAHLAGEVGAGSGRHREKWRGDAAEQAELLEQPGRAPVPCGVGGGHGIERVGGEAAQQIPADAGGVAHQQRVARRRADRPKCACRDRGRQVAEADQANPIEAGGAELHHQVREQRHVARDRGVVVVGAQPGAAEVERLARVEHAGGLGRQEPPGIGVEEGRARGHAVERQVDQQGQAAAQRAEPFEQRRGRAAAISRVGLHRVGEQAVPACPRAGQHQRIEAEGCGVGDEGVDRPDGTRRGEPETERARLFKRPRCLCRLQRVHPMYPLANDLCGDLVPIPVSGANAGCSAAVAARSAPLV